MKDTLVKKLTIIIESTKYKSLSSEMIKAIDALEKSIASHNELILSYALTQHADEIKNKNTDYISPANWDYWQV